MDDAFLSRWKIERIDGLADDPESEVFIDSLAHLQLADHEVQEVGRIPANSDANHPRCFLEGFQK